MPTPSRPLLCCALSLGYGPAAKLLAVAELLAARGLALHLAGSGVALELAQRRGGLFHEISAVRSAGDLSRAAMESVCGVFSVMDREIAALTVRNSKPLFVLDSLLWMRDDVPAAWRAARIFWAQNFPGVAQSAADLRLAARMIGPVVPPRTAPAEQPASGELLVNLGAAESTGDGGRMGQEYARFVTEALLASELAGRFAEVTLIAGERSTAALESQFPSCGIDFRSIPHDEALDLLDRAEVVLTSPGLTTTLESFERGRPTFFLPPQNYSQWCILRTLRSINLTPASLHWEDLQPSPPLADRLPEAIRNPIVRAAVQAALASKEASQRLVNCLNKIGQTDTRDLADRQSKFFATLGTNGTETVASQLLNSLAFAPMAGHV